LISIGENSIDTVATALLEGNMEFFIDQLPTSDKYKSDYNLNARVESYKATIKDIIDRTDILTGKVNIARDELRTIFDYVVGKIPETPNKFTSLLKHHRVHVKKVWINNKSPMGIATKFSDLAHFQTYVASHFTAPTTKMKAKTP
jgi:hypothetical protein